ncbi:hypothetical protein [Pseudomonas sp. S3_E10]
MVNGDTITHTHQVFIAVLVGKSAGKTVILCHSLLNGYQKFDTMAQLGASLPTLMYRLDPYDRLLWRLYEPTDDFFAHQACAMITLPIEAHTRFDVSASTPIVKPVPGGSAGLADPGGLYLGPGVLCTPSQRPGLTQQPERRQNLSGRYP